MALMAGLGQAATVAQLVGADASGLISMILQAAVTARQNKKECEQLARRILMVADLLPHLQDPEVLRRPEVRRPLEGLGDTLREANELVTSCQGRSAAYRFFTAGRQAERFRDVQSRIDSYLLVFPFISHIDITRRLDLIYTTLVPDRASEQSTATSQPESSSQLVVVHGDGTEEFTHAEILAATNNFARENLIGEGGFGRVFKGRLLDGREVAVKRMAGMQELTILSSLRHDNIVRLLGWSVQKEERMLVLEHMRNDTLLNHLHGWTSSSSPVRTSWRTRIKILLGVSRAIEHLHCRTAPPVIHGDIKPANVLLDGGWVPHLSDFSGSTTCSEASSRETAGRVYGTVGYTDPEFYITRCLTPTSDVYSFGVLMLEVLTGKRPNNWLVVDEVDDSGLVAWALELIEAGESGRMMDRRPEVPETTPRQLEAAGMVACTAACCLQLQGEDRPAISKVVANLEAAVDLLRGSD